MMKPKIANRVQSEISARNEDENVGTESMARGINATNLISERVKLDRYGEKLHTWTKKQVTRSETFTKGLGRQTAKDIQKSRARRQMIDIYQKKKAKEAAGTAAGLGKKFVDASSDMAGRIGEFVVEHIAQDPKPFVIIGIIALLLVLVCCMFSSCTLMAGGINSSAIATYTAEETKTEEPAQISIIKRPVGQKKYVTAFVDESIRINPWRLMDESIPEKQGFYSYIICLYASK